MSFVPYSKEFATLEEKHKIRKMLEYIGITSPGDQIAFLSALLGKPFDSSRLSLQEAIDIKRKIKTMHGSTRELIRGFVSPPLQTEKESKA